MEASAGSGAGARSVVLSFPSALSPNKVHQGTVIDPVLI